MRSPHITESDDAFEIAVEGLAVTQCRFDYAVTLVLDDGATSFTIRISEPFVLRGCGTAEWRLDPERRPAEGAPMLRRAPPSGASRRPQSQRIRSS